MTAHPRFGEGMDWELNRIHCWVTSGNKAPGDLVLNIRTPPRGRQVPMSLGMLMIDFFWQNEEHLMKYRPHWFLGGDKYIHALQEAYIFGWEPAVRRLTREKKRAA